MDKAMIRNKIDLDLIIDVINDDTVDVIGENNVDFVAVVAVVVVTEDGNPAVPSAAERVSTIVVNKIFFHLMILFNALRVSGHLIT